MVIKFLLSLLLLISSMTVGAQTMLVMPAESTQSDRFYIGTTVKFSFNEDEMSIVPTEGSGEVQTYTLSHSPTLIVFSEQEVVPVKLRVVPGQSYGIASFVAPETINLKQMAVDNDLTAYFATEIKEESVTLSPVTVIGKEQASLLKGNAGWHFLPIDKDAAPSNIPNMFQGSLTNSYTVKSTDNIYAFSISAANFCQIEPNVTIPAGKAYLVSPKLSASTLSLNFNELYDEETAAKTVTVAKNSDAVRYNVTGQRVSSNAKGLVISKGIKLLIK